MPPLARRTSLALVLLSALAGPAGAQESGSPPPRGCAAPEHRQFDFWIGEWEVSNPAGKPVGHNSIESILGGCVVRETWTGGSGTNGTSYNAFDRQRRRWHQTWVDNAGLVLRLEGEFAGGKMVLSGETLDGTGKVVLNRITWQETGPGALRQLWEVSSDGGKTWAVAFDGRYRKR